MLKVGLLSEGAQWISKNPRVAACCNFSCSDRSPCPLRRWPAVPPRAAAVPASRRDAMAVAATGAARSPAAAAAARPRAEIADLLAGYPRLSWRLPGPGQQVEVRPRLAIVRWGRSETRRDWWQPRSQPG